MHVEMSRRISWLIISVRHHHVDNENVQKLQYIDQNCRGNANSAAEARSASLLSESMYVNVCPPREAWPCLGPICSLADLRASCSVQPI